MSVLDAATSQGRGGPRNGPMIWQDTGWQGPGRGGDGRQLDMPKVGRLVRKWKQGTETPEGLWDVSQHG